MEGEYPVLWEGQCVGNVQINRVGLYYELACTCNIGSESKCQLMIEGQKGLENIGLLIPEHGALVLKKRIAVKHFGPKMPVFSVQERANTMVETVAVQPDFPFDHLQKLHRAYLVWSGEEPRLAFRKIP